VNVTTTGKSTCNASGNEGKAADICRMAGS